MSADAGPGTITIEQVDAVATHALRLQELRQGRPAEMDGDDAPYALHLAARLHGGAGPDGEIVGVVRFHPRDCPWLAAEAPWQLRGMATDPRVRGLGVGRALVAEGLTRVVQRGADLVWCDARAAAVGFYERIGFTPVTDEYDLQPVGPHRGMVLTLPIS